MIYVKKIIVVEFRGIRNLAIDFNGKNFAICGRNGTGKSGIVDALEFALTGSISRLSGSGTGGVSLKEHAPHVDSRSNPEKAHVVLTVSIPNLGDKEVTIRRTVGNPGAPVITPSSPDILKILHEVATHPEFTLSRRELIKYVISPPGDRAKAVQALLRLDEVENMRTILQKITNTSKKEVPFLKKEKENSQQSLVRALQITELTVAKALSAVNKQRLILGLHDIKGLTSATSLKDGLATNTVAATLVSVPKIQALADIKMVHDVSAIIASHETSVLILSTKVKLAELATDPTIADGVAREHLLQSAVELINNDMCPVCDTPWDPVLLKDLVGVKLKHFDSLTAKRIVLEKELASLITHIDELVYSLKAVVRYSNLLKPAIDADLIKNYISKIQSDSQKLVSFFPIIDTLAVIEGYGAIPSDVSGIITQIETAVVAIPDATKQDSARDYLTIGQERMEAYRSASLLHKQAEEKAKLSEAIFDIYARVSTDILNDIYKKVQKDFIDLYRFINNDDEGDFEAELTPSIGKLSFDVDFYGRGFFPPGAYHSEGHQDGMGLCLYLALRKHLLGDAFTFAVLDDVLMSVDSGHRRQVCKLLKDKFPNTQFILTTHDKVWLKHMETEGLIKPKASMFFKNWDVDNGPSEWNDRDIWTEIADELKIDRVPVAAGLLRNYLEYISSEICHQLRAQVEFHGDGHFDLGDLLPQATSRFSKLLSEGEAVATSWKKTDDVESIKKRKADFTALVAQSHVENWQTNTAIHYNEWANLDVKDFTPVVDVYSKLVSSFFCSEPTCGSVLYVTPSKGQKEMLRCTCGTISINLIKK